MRKHLVAVSEEAIAVENGMGKTGFVEQHLEDALALDLRGAAEVKAFQKEKIEGVEHHPVLPAVGEFGLEFGKVGPAILDHDYFAVENHAFDGNRECVCDQREAFGPVQAIAGVDRDPALVEMDLDPVAVVFDFMKSLVAFGRLGFQRRELGLDESRHVRTFGAFDRPRNKTGTRTHDHLTTDGWIF